MLTSWGHAGVGPASPGPGWRRRNGMEDEDVKPDTTVTGQMDGGDHRQLRAATGAVGGGGARGS